jgi:hypothetical protein
MDKKSALRLRPGMVVLYSECSSHGPPTWWGRVRKVTERGGVLIEPFRQHWHDAPPEPDCVEALLSRNWDDVGPEERWIPCQWIYRAH